jgi:hypothetical protein
MKRDIVKAKVADLHHAKWNYKTDGTQEQLEKLAKSIEKYGPGVPAVRIAEDEDGKEFLEVMDGNHRLTALRMLGIEEITIENYGHISQADAIILTRNRNQNWFEDDKLLLANLMVSHVFPETSMEELASFMPETVESLESLKLLGEAEWTPPTDNQDDNGGGSNNDLDNAKKIFLKVNEETFNLWNKWLERCESITGLDSQERAFEFAVIEALNVPEEMLTQPRKQS